MRTLPIQIEEVWLKIRKPLWEAALEAESPQACAEILQAVEEHVANGGNFLIFGGGEWDGDAYRSGHRHSEVDELRAEAEGIRKDKGLAPLPEA
jgi:hypothetical protein